MVAVELVVEVGVVVPPQADRLSRSEPGVREDRDEGRVWSSVGLEQIGAHLFDHLRRERPDDASTVLTGLADGPNKSTRMDGPDFVLDPERLRAANVVTLSTTFGELKLIAEPAGVPRGYDALKAGASTEHLGGGLRPEIASTGDLIAMSAALRRDQDLKRIPALRRILELEADPAAIVKPTPVGVEQLHPGLPPGTALDGELSHLERSRRAGPGKGPGVGR
jgi:hypothetical protein